MKVSAGEGVKSCGFQTSPWTWESDAVRRFRFQHAVNVAIKQVGKFSICYVFICFCNHSSRSSRSWEINLCLAAFTDPPLENWDHFLRENFTTILRTDGIKIFIPQDPNLASGRELLDTLERFYLTPYLKHTNGQRPWRLLSNYWWNRILLSFYIVSV